MPRELTPGAEVLSKLLDEVREPKVVDQLKPIDVSYIDDPGMRAVVALATALDWNVVHKNGKPVTLIARDGFKHVLPTDTSVRFQVFVNRVNATITHSITAIPSIELMEKIIKQYKLDPSHARVFKAAAGDGVMDDVVAVGDDPDERLPGSEPLLHVEETVNPLDLPRLEGDPPEPFVEFLPTERVEPTLAHRGEGEQYISPIMDTVIRQLVADGADQITYRCKICGLEFETKRSVGSHWQVHVKAGEAEATAGMKKETVNVVPDYVPTEVHNRRDYLPELRRLRKIVSDVQKAVGQDSIKEAERKVMVIQRKLDDVMVENARLTERNTALERSLGTLHELLGELRDPTTKTGEK